MTTQIEVVQSASYRQLQSSVNAHVEEYEADGFVLTDQELDVENNSVTAMLVFEDSE